MPNRLINTSSPYLLQHANNPVDWHPWDEIALQKARAEDKPIFLSIGYAACHWCHVMAHESFEDPATAEILNSYFVSIKVDREERPDLDSIYMDAVVAITGQGGWPMSVFLTPEGKPFHGGTYFPPTRRYNLPSFKEVLLAIARAWQQDRANLRDHADNIFEHLRIDAGFAGDSQTLHLSALDKAAAVLIQNYDWLSGGWGNAPKFPQPQLIEFLLRCAVRGKHRTLDAAVHALTAMAKGGMFDLVGGGFARYSTDTQWFVPHFEKMLYDNALLSRAYLHAYLMTGDVAFRKICEQTLDFILNELTDPGGGFFSSLDADSEGEEGKYYLWTPSEIYSILEPAGLSALFMRAFAITEQGNFEGKNIIRRAIDASTLSAEFQIEPAEVEQRIDQALLTLRSVRSTRIRPATDDKIILVWNALTLTSFAEAGRFLQRDDYLDMAMRNYLFLMRNLMAESGLLVRSWRKYKSTQPAFLEDYAALILGILALYQARPEHSLYAAAHKLTSTMLGLFKDEDSPVIFDTSNQHTDIILRPKSFQDGATPSGASLAAEALLKMAALSGNTDWRDKAVQAMGTVSRAMVEHPTAFGNWLCAADYALGPTLEIALIGDSQKQTYRELKRVLDQEYLPNTILASSAFPASADDPELLHNRVLLGNQPTAYVCQNFTCKLPTNQPDELRRQLDDYCAVLKSQPGNQPGD